MSLRKWCSPTLAPAHPLHCLSSPDCGHHWFYDFRVNRRRYRNTTETDHKQKAKAIEARERSRVLDGRHQIRQLPDVTFAQFAATYLRDYAEQNKRSVARDREILKVLIRAFGSVLLHEITGLRIEQFKRDRLAGKWRGHQHTGPAKPIRPGTVNRELDTLRSVFSKAVEWKMLREHPMDAVKRLKVDNRRTRILTEAEQAALLKASPKVLARIVRLALISGARIGELLALKWEDVTETELWLIETKNGRSRRLPRSPAIEAALRTCPRGRSPWLFTNKRTHQPYTVNGVAHVFKRALVRAGITTGDVTLHTLRHTALSRMIAAGIDDFTVMALSGHQSVRMLERYTHPTAARQVDALESFSAMGRNGAEPAEDNPKSAGGRQEARTPDLRVANAALSQLS
jgi:integrase